MIKQPLDSSKIGVPVPSQPGNYQEAMMELQKPLTNTNNVLQRAMEMKNKVLPYSTMPPLDLKKALRPQITKAQEIESNNMEEITSRRKTASELTDLGMKYNQALLQQELTERGLYTKQATEMMMASQQRVNKMMEMKVDPGRFFKDMPTWHKIVGFIGIVAAGVLNARAGYDPNQAFIGINNLIEQDVQAQTRDLEWAKYEHEKIDLMDSKKLALMADTIESRNHIRSNLTALTNAYIGKVTSHLTDQSAISNSNSLRNTLYKTAGQEIIKSMFTVAALKKQAGLAGKMQHKIEQEEEFIKQSWNKLGRTGVVAMGWAAKPGETTKLEKFRNGTLEPEVEAELKKLGVYHTYETVAKTKDQVEEIQKTAGPWSREFKLHNVQNWLNSHLDILTVDPQRHVRGLRGNIGYLNEDLSPTELGRFREVFQRMEPMKKLARALVQIDGLMEMGTPIPPPDGTDDQYNFIDPYVRQKAEEKGLDFDQMTAKEKDALKNDVFYELNDEKKKQGLFAQLRQGVGIKFPGDDKESEKQRERLMAQHIVIANARIAVASVVRLMSAEGGLKISDIEWARTAKGVTGTDDLNNFSIQEMNPWESLDKTRNAISYLMLMLNQAQNAALEHYLDTASFPRDTDNLPYMYKSLAYDMSKLPNSDPYNIIYLLSKYHGLDANRLSNIPMLQKAASSFYSRKLGTQGPVVANKEFVRVRVEEEKRKAIGPQWQQMQSGIY